MHLLHVNIEIFSFILDSLVYITRGTFAVPSARDSCLSYRWDPECDPTSAEHVRPRSPGRPVWVRVFLFNSAHTVLRAKKCHEACRVESPCMATCERSTPLVGPKPRTVIARSSPGFREYILEVAQQAAQEVAPLRMICGCNT